MQFEIKGFDYFGVGDYNEAANIFTMHSLVM